MTTDDELKELDYVPGRSEAHEAARKRGDASRKPVMTTDEELEEYKIRSIVYRLLRQAKINPKSVEPIDEAVAAIKELAEFSD